MATAFEKKQIEVTLTVPRLVHERVCDYIIAHLAGGLVLEENPARVTIRFYLPESRGLAFKEDLAQFVRTLDGLKNFSTSDIFTKAIAELDWIQAYRESVKPIIIDKVRIRPPWAQPEANGKVDIIIEPKMAFGTGTHETTRLCLRQIARHFQSGWSMFDLGCGSGILSLLAAKMGASRITAVDIDPESFDNARENMELNGVAERVTVMDGSIEQALEGQPFDFLAGNLIRETIIELYDKMNAAVRPGGVILLSGLLREDENAIAALLHRPDVARFEITSDGQWLAFTVFKK